MFSPILISKINEFTKDSSIPASLLIAEQDGGYGLHFLIISTRYDSGMLYKELGKYKEKADCEAAAYAALKAIEVYEECQMLTVSL